MVALLAFAVILLVAVFLSELAQVSVPSIAVLSLVTGFVTGNGALEWVSVGCVGVFKLTLFGVLFSGQRPKQATA